MAPRIHGYNLATVAPLREWADSDSRFRVCKVGSSTRPIRPPNSTVQALRSLDKPVVSVQLLAGNGQCVVDGV